MSEVAASSGARRRVVAPLLGVVLVGFLVAGLVIWLPQSAYLWMKALHVIAVIAWMAGLLYLPRLFVYHVGVAPDSETSQTFKVMERRLLKAIMNPAMLVAAITGLWLAIAVHGLQGGWLHAKLAILLVLFAVHGHLAASVRHFASNSNEKTSRYWRIMNEVPTLAMIIIVILVIVQPF